MAGPYFSMDGMAFQTTGSDIESRINTRMALKALESFIYGRTDMREAEEALRYLAGVYDKLAPFCQDYMRAFYYDCAVDQEMIRRICTPAYNSIVRRLQSV